ncbi:hypothetical protein SAMN04487965_1329 [Microbulbifer donghaiensis]|uniref:Uncharacterized protein n=1 Tax=Microbulbifer donghaiensis TaxID=494016 RepID=A0A1M4YT06_9GAMM|nr:hypothetical protein [Microbulbifer donghaiensis]SHF08466.1 hypothetical protein SAMN04487965_1329 [Microbulbifer donghaiensis]
MKISTEDQRIALDHVKFQVSCAIEALVEKKNEIEAQSNNQEQLDVLMIRLDALAKLSKYLIEPLSQAYLYIENGSEVRQIGDLGAITEDIKSNFTKSIIQGL